jgi:hypothetical protein
MIKQQDLQSILNLLAVDLTREIILASVSFHFQLLLLKFEYNVYLSWNQLHLLFQLIQKVQHEDLLKTQ